ncbi:response regulator [Spirochaeta africana]|nr:response regulator [Spirochaeta africana]
MIVEDEPVTAMGLQTRLRILGHSVIGIAATGEEAFQLVRSEKPDLVLLDVSLAGRASGIDVAKRLSIQLPDTRFAFLTAADAADLHREIHDLDPVAVIRKPLIDDLYIEMEDGVLQL